MILRDLILLTVDDLVLDFAVYDRKEDEELTRDDLHQAVLDGEVTVDEIVERFRTALEEHMN